MTDAERQAILKTACQVGLAIDEARRWLLGRQAPALKPVAEKFPLYPA